MRCFCNTYFAGFQSFIFCTIMTGEAGGMTVKETKAQSSCLRLRCFRERVFYHSRIENSCVEVKAISKNRDETCLDKPFQKEMAAPYYYTHTMSAAAVTQNISSVRGERSWKKREPPPEIRRPQDRPTRGKPQNAKTASRIVSRTAGKRRAADNTVPSI